MRSLNLDQLRALQAVVDAGGFTAAAKRLSLSQPAVSTQIRELEERLGVRLLERLGKRAFPTAAGLEAIAHGRRIAQEAAALEAAMRRHRDGHLGQVRLGVGAHILVHLLPPVLKELHETQPGLEITIQTGVAAEIRQMVVENTLDLALITMPIDDTLLAVTPVLSVPLLAVMPQTEREAPATVGPGFFAQRTLILLDTRSLLERMIRDWLRAGGVEPRPAMELGNPDAIRNVVAAGLGVSILPPEVAAAPVPAGGVLTRPLAPAILQETAIIQRRDKPDAPGLRIVREALAGLRRLGAPPARPSRGRT